MIRAIVSMLLAAAAFSPLAGAVPGVSPNALEEARVRQLKAALAKEKPQFDIRESQRRNMLEELDRINADQNRVRERIRGFLASQQELTMALENLILENDKQRALELAHKRSLLLLLKIVYRVRRDGMVRFLVNGDDLSAIASRVRVLFRTLRSHSLLTQQLGDRTRRLADTERRLAQAKEEHQRLIGELNEHEALLSGILQRKRKVLSGLNVKQGRYQALIKEYQQVSKQLAVLFQNFESMRDTVGTGNPRSVFPSRGSLPLPIETGTVVSQFGKSVHRKFQTVTFRKGIEIEAEQFAPVKAILSGVVEYEGWVKGLGNVMILHHGAGFYTLSAHLHKALLPRGTRVGQGETIGLVGDTGNSERASLYFEIRENSKAVDPVAYFSPRALSTLH